MNCSARTNNNINGINPTVIAIHDPDDPRVASYRTIRERDLVGRQGRFVAEGKVVLNVLLTARRFAVESLLVLENRLAGMAQILAMVPRDVPIYSVSQQVIDAITGFHMHRGVLAIGRRREEEGPAALLASLPPRALVVALAGISNHDNMGAIFRNAAAFGAAAVLMDETCCDPLYRKAIRVSVGAALKVPFAHGGDATGLVAELRRHDFSPLALSPRGEMEISEVTRADRMALFFGTEGPGLPEALLAAMPTARISMAPGFDSLNVAAASAIALHRLYGED